MIKLDLIELIERNLRDYRLGANDSLCRNYHMNSRVMDRSGNIPQEIIDALLVDFLNYVSNWQGVDYGMYTKDLNEKLIPRKEREEQLRRELADADKGL